MVHPRIWDLAGNTAGVCVRFVTDATEIHARWTVTSDALLSAGDFPGGFRAGVELRGFAMGTSRQPLCDASDAARMAIRRELDAVLNHLSIATAL